MQKILASRWFWPSAGLIIGLITVFFLGRAVLPHRFAGTVVQSPNTAADFTLTGAGDVPVSLSDFRGRVVLLYFGYTACPDICPTTLQELMKALDLLGGKAGQVQVIMVSVDPEKDTPQRLDAYLRNLDPAERLIGLTGSQDQIQEAATQYGVFYQKRENAETSLSYLVDHTATVMLIDRKGYLRVVYPYGTPADGIASDLRYILRK